ncbi:SHOCT domain-containing protein [Streptomyces sp. TLI_185]|uniref:SHOCT domain-containing protein n=1 Tax=Streptomyces sp. TLI_185 TaxID=2485151 RepID=UPI000F514B9C|nr:SHOCT domain-containing protein [Streptomyces sp. TLI_185]RPF30918.1 putative oligomerization/nucleic acid binding protein [Streptomyces sp. TLI_185]
MPLGRRRPLLRGALVGGTAYAAGRRATQAQQHEVDQQAAIDQLQAQQASAAPAAPAAAPQPSAGSALLDELTRLGELRDQGVLTDAEFAAAKARLLGT